MFRNNYDNDSVTFSPQGRIFQVEYASEAVKQGSVVVGIVSKTHAVLAAVKVRLAPRDPRSDMRSHVDSDKHCSATQKSFRPTRRRSFQSTLTSVSPSPVLPPTPAFFPTS